MFYVKGKIKNLENFILNKMNRIVFYINNLQKIFTNPLDIYINLNIIQTIIIPTYSFMITHYALRNNALLYT